MQYYDGRAAFCTCAQPSSVSTPNFDAEREYLDEAHEKLIAQHTLARLDVPEGRVGL